MASVVVTLQDLPPIKELGRQRAEFMSMVSRELLAPLTSITGSATAVLEDRTRLDPARTREFFSLIKWQARPDAGPDLGPAGGCPHRGGERCW